MDDLRTISRSVPFDTVIDAVDPINATGGLGSYLLNWILPAGNRVPPYWSPTRDAWIRDFVVSCDPLKVATATFINKAISIPLTISARDSSVKAHNARAVEMQKALNYNSGLMAGFKHELKKFMFDYLTSDNGAFFLVMGRGRAIGPIVGAPTGVIHLDSCRCQRTGDPEFPIIYHNVDGNRYAIHYTRLITISNMPSPRAEMNGVGVSAASCAIDAAQEIVDMTVYYSEKLGSRPPRQILYIKRGGTIDMLRTAVEHFGTKLNSEGLSRFSKTLLLAPKIANQELDLATLDLSSVPDGFDRQQITVMDLALLASAYGLDLRDLAVSFGVAGSTRADAEIQDKKGRGKGVHEFIETLTERMNLVYLPEYLELSFDTLDDDQDQQRAEIRSTRSAARERDLRSGLTTVRIERETMLESGEISASQFEEMELQDGRTPEGLDILFLFHSTDVEISSWLGGFEVPDPTDIANNDPEEILDEIQERKQAVFGRIETAPNARIARKARQALAALEKLQSMYQQPAVGPDVDQRVALEAMAAGQDQMGEMEDSPEDEAEDMAEGESDLEDIEEQPPPEEKQIDPDSLPDDPDAMLEEVVNAYGHDFDALVEQALRGELAREQLNDALGDIIGSILLLLFLRGALKSQGELNDQDRFIINDFIAVNQNALQGFLDDVFSGRYSMDELGLAGAMRRIDTWQNMAVVAYSLGQLQQRGDPYLRWQFGPTEHCHDCARLNGQVHRASEWKNSGWTPRSFGLECRGFRCQCRFEPASGPSVGTF